MKPSSAQRRRKQRDPHGWNSEQGYFNAHEKRLDRLRSYFIEDDTLEIVPIGGDQIRIQGRISCKYGLFVDVYKTLRRNARGQVQTVDYSYEACVAGQSERQIFRYDNAHPHRGHPDAHHKHEFNPTTWKENKPPTWIGRDHWPHLDQVIIELHDWWWNVGQHLDLWESDTS